uniref:RNase H type-1 domain-containing protein n=2 Tax=Oryza punctata TaxID=4537 RepID=A0A0E0MDY2_ORYPU
MSPARSLAVARLVLAMSLRHINQKPWSLLKPYSLPLCVRFSSESSTSNSTADNDVPVSASIPYPKHWFKLPPWIKLAPIHENPDIVKWVGSDSFTAMEAYETTNLEILFDQKVRPFLVSRCMLACEPINGPIFKQLHFMRKDLISQFPIYVTSLSVMKCLIQQREAHWTPILHSLAVDKVVVLRDWENESTPIEVTFFDHGLDLASQSETTCDSITCKAECDGSFYKVSVSASTPPKAGGGATATEALAPAETEGLAPETTVGSAAEGPASVGSEETVTIRTQKTGKSTIASIIWNSKMMLDSQITCELPCEDSEHAEALAVLSVLQLARKLNIKKIDVVLDNVQIYEVMTGKRDVFKHKHRKVLMEAIEVSKGFDVCRSRWEPRELLCLVNEMANATRDNYTAKTLSLRKVLESRASCLWGLPVIRINQTTNTITSKLEKARAKEVDMRMVQSKAYHVNVQGQVLKPAALEGLLYSLNPPFLVVLVGSDESAREVLPELNWRYPCMLVRGCDEVDDAISTPNGDSSPIQQGTALIPRFSAQKVLLVAYDSLSDQIQFAPDQDTSGVVTVSIIAPHEKGSLAKNSNEVDHFIYGFFNSVKITPRKQNPPKKSFGEMLSMWENRRKGGE